MRIGILLAPWLSGDKITAETTTQSPIPGELAYVYSKAKLVVTVFLFRVCYICAMAVSCHFIPEHNPGDGVVRFDMRLDDTNPCYCLRGHACDHGLPNSIDEDSSSDCAIPFTYGSVAPPSLWKFFLAPLTKWDAARFLTLAVNPSLRYPTSSLLHTLEDSEQAHAFLPMFPWIIQQFSLFLYRILPVQLSPPTFESLVVFGGMVFNNFICLTVATLALYNLTIFVMSSSEAGELQQQRKHRHHFVAIVVCLVFGVWNPALVFFATNYSESFFAASTILGHLCVQRSKIEGRITFWFIGIACWMVGSYTRSNGMLHCLWLLQDGLARIILLLRHKKSVDKQCKLNATARNSSIPVLGQVILICTQSIMGAILVAFPVRYHDWKGWERHCTSLGVRPLWCRYSDENPSVLGSSFSLYRHVQDKHWNVGFFRYYEWKQVPNFLLAAPILMLSIAGVYQWIHWALITVYGKGKAPSSYKNLFVGWPIDALSDSVSVSNASIAGTASKIIRPTPSTESRLLLKNPHLLGHYAIVAILTFLGLVIAHVQISTRMICSTSPAIIWYIAHCLLSLPSPSTASYGTTKSKENEQKKNRRFSFIVQNQSKVVWFYVGLYMFLGAILHVNFLPWT
jgi:phosphatidylinositol glycan class V